ncbi:MAG TPA: helical backbone metal receptor [Polyangiaceae bacterium]|nr:helical backbone metal receptor [Polyangiaceae bacterium]
MQRFRDDLGREFFFHRPPARVASLVPSETYSLARLGALDRLVARTDYCVEPAGALAAVPSVGGTKSARVEDVLDARPDLVLANQEENTRSQIEAIDQAGVPVFVSFPRRVADGFAHLARLARLLGLAGEPRVKDLVRDAYEALREAEARRGSRAPLRAFAPIWMDPLMTINGETYISDTLDLVGAVNVFADRPRRYPLAADLGLAPALPPERAAGRDTRYPRVPLDEVAARRPAIVLLPDEPHAFTAADAEALARAGVPAEGGKVAFCSGKDLCWPGAWAIEGLKSLGRLVDSLREGAARPG